MNKGLIITNNPELGKLIGGKYKVILYPDCAATEILTMVRDFVHLNHSLLTHPLQSSLPKSESPYRSVVITSQKATQLDFNSLETIERAIVNDQNFLEDREPREWNEQILSGFSLIDYDLISKALI